MPSLHQSHTRVTHIPDLGHLTAEDRIAQIETSSKTKILMMPALYSEFETREGAEQPAMDIILNELKNASYIDHIVLGLDGATREQYQEVVEKMEALPQKVHVLWNDGPLSRLRDDLASKGLAPVEKGKGRNVWGMMGSALHLAGQDGKDPDDAVIAMHDCDIVTYNQDMPAGLFHALCIEDGRYDYVKGHYPRHDGNKLNGRVTRLFVPAYIKALRDAMGDQDAPVRRYLDYMDSYRYPLSGEMGFSGKALRQMDMPGDWSIEVEILRQMYENTDLSVCDISIADQYDHKHQDVSEDKKKGLSRMVTEIGAAFLRKISALGHDVTPEKIAQVQDFYKEYADRLRNNFNSVAIANGLNPNTEVEKKNISTFAERISDSFEYFQDEHFTSVPNWTVIQKQAPNALCDLACFVSQDRAALDNLTRRQAISRLGYSGPRLAPSTV